jgi:hypothetical protein
MHLARQAPVASVARLPNSLHHKALVKMSLCGGVAEWLKALAWKAGKL